MSSTNETPDKLKVAELKTLLKERGLDVSGRKAELVSRLEEALASESGTGTVDTTADGTASKEDVADAETAEPTEAAAPKPTPAAPAAATETASEAAAADAKSSAAELIAAKKRRAERFGVEVTITKEEKQKLKREQQKANKQAKQAELKAVKAELEEKKKARAARFGQIPKPVATAGQKNKESSAPSASTQPTKKQKGNKGEQVITARAVTKEEYAKMEARAKKFGTVVPAGITIAGEEALKKLQRAERFASTAAKTNAPLAAEAAPADKE